MEIGRIEYFTAERQRQYEDYKRTQIQAPVFAVNNTMKAGTEEEETVQMGAGQELADHLSGKKRAPYDYLADENGMISYNGVTFQCDTTYNTISLGDVSNKDNVLTIPLSGGGTLLVNKDNLDALSKSIGMFSPEDVNRILRAITADHKAEQMKMEIEDEESKVGEDVAEPGETGEEKTDELEQDSSQDEWKSQVYRSMFSGTEDSVEAAWKKAAEESGFFGHGLEKEGVLTRLEEVMLLDRDRAEYANILGETKESALSYAEESLAYLNAQEKRELRQQEIAFYEKFIGFLSA